MGTAHELRADQRDVDVASHVVSLFVRADALDAEVALLQLGVGDQFGGGRLGLDPARHHHQLAVGHAHRGAQVLLDDEHRDALRHELVHDFDQRVDDGRGQALRRLVHDHQRAVQQQRPTDGEHLLLAAGELGRRRCDGARRGVGTARTRLRVVQRLPRVPLASIVRCSSTVSDGNRRRPCGTYEIPCRAIFSGPVCRSARRRSRPHRTSA